MSSALLGNGIHLPRSQLLLAVVIFELVLGTLAIALRAYTRLRITHEGQKWSFIWALFAWVAGFVDCVVICLAIYYGLGIHIWLLSPDAILNTSKWCWITNATSRPAVIGGRNAVVSFIYEIQGRQAALWRRSFLWFIAVSNTLLNFLLTFWIFFRCLPPTYLWDKSIRNGRCPYEATNQILAYFIVGYGALSDLALACYPVTFLLSLNMSFRKRVGISMLMGMGVFACVCATMTTYSLHVVSKTTDPTYLMMPLTMWANTEMWMILIASSIAPCWPFFKQIFRSERSSVSSSQRHIIRHQTDDSPDSEKRKQEMSITVTSDFSVEFEDENNREKK